jgi:N-acetyl-anhydromuramyl-L-alanine amidase AmpD
MSNSSLVNFTKISPNKSVRKGKISKITIHHMAGNLTVESCGNVFAPASRKASSNYGVGTDGRVGLYVPENYRSWASSSPENDHIAVTIEVANDGGANWHVSDKALQKTIELCADVCKRNGIKKLNFTGDKTGNLTMHRYFAATNCPGPYLESKFPYIADEVNKILSGKKEQVKEEAKKEPIPELTTANDIVWELGERGLVLDTHGMLKEMNENPDGRLYWLARKMLNYIRQKGI